MPTEPKARMAAYVLVLFSAICARAGCCVHVHVRMPHAHTGQKAGSPLVTLLSILGNYTRFMCHIKAYNTQPIPNTAMPTYMACCAATFS